MKKPTLIYLRGHISSPKGIWQAREAMPDHLAPLPYGQAKRMYWLKYLLTFFVATNAVMMALPVVGAMTGAFGVNWYTGGFALLIGLVVVVMATITSGASLFRKFRHEWAAENPGFSKEHDALIKSVKMSVAYEHEDNVHDHVAHLQASAALRMRQFALKVALGKLRNTRLSWWKRTANAWARLAGRNPQYVQVQDSTEDLYQAFDHKDFIKAVAKQGSPDKANTLLECVYLKGPVADNARLVEATSSWMGSVYDFAKEIVGNPTPANQVVDVFEMLFDAMRFARVSSIDAYSNQYLGMENLHAGQTLLCIPKDCYGQLTAVKARLTKMDIDLACTQLGRLTQLFQIGFDSLCAEIAAHHVWLQAQQDSFKATPGLMCEHLDDMKRHEKKLMPSKAESFLGGVIARPIAVFNAFIVNAVIMLFGCTMGLAGLSELIGVDLVGLMAGPGIYVFMGVCALGAAIGSITLTLPRVEAVFKSIGRVIDARREKVARAFTLRQVVLTATGLTVTAASVYYGYSSGLHLIHGAGLDAGLAGEFGGFLKHSPHGVDIAIGFVVAFFTLVCAGSLYVRFATKHNGHKHPSLGRTKRDEHFPRVKGFKNRLLAWLKSWANRQNVGAAVAAIGLSFVFCWRFIADLPPALGVTLAVLTSFIVLRVYVAMTKRSLDMVYKVDVPRLPPSSSFTDAAPQPFRPPVEQEDPENQHWADNAVIPDLF